MARTKEDFFKREIKYCTSSTTAPAARGGDCGAETGPSRRPTCRCGSRDIFSGESRRRSSTTASSTTARSFFNRTAPELVERFEFYEDEEPLFERYGVEEALQSVLRRRVDLPSGGYLMIDYAEAMTVIDVNSGSFTGRGKGAKLRDTITRNEPRGGRRGRRQLRLRDIGPDDLVIDSIDMARRATATPVP